MRRRRLGRSLRGRLPAGLRWRLLMALVLTSAVSLALAAARRRRRRCSRTCAPRAPRACATPCSTRRPRSSARSPPRRTSAAAPIITRAFELRRQTDARDPGRQPGARAGRRRHAARLHGRHGHLHGHAVGRADRRAGHERRRDRSRTSAGDSLSVGVPLFDPQGVSGAVVAERRLTEVTTLVGQVRNAFLAAAGVGLLVAVLLATGLSSTLLRRLARLRAAALRITEAGPDAPPMPHDERRDEVGDLARALARMQEELRRQETARRAFVSTASHELRTPLTMLQGTMELLEEDLTGRRRGPRRRPPAGGHRAARAAPPVRARGRAARPLPAGRRRAAALGARGARRGRPRGGGGVRAARQRAGGGARRRAAGRAVLGPRRPGRGGARGAHPARQRAALRAARASPCAILAGGAATTRLGHGGRPRAAACRRRSASTSSSASTAAAPRAPRAASASASPSAASSPLRMGGDLRLADPDPGTPGACFVLTLRSAASPARAPGGARPAARHARLNGYAAS